MRPDSILRRACGAALASAALLLGGCDRRLEPWIDVADEPPRSEKPVRIPGLAQPVPDPMPAVAVRGGAAADSIRGTVRLDAGATIAAGSVLFLVARAQAGGPPLAVKRLPPGPFPLSFEIGAEDVMIAGRPFVGPILLSARVDGDGDPLTRSPGDLAALSGSPVEPGAHSVDLLLAPSAP